MNRRDRHHFDLLLVVDYFRSATPYLCLIEALSNRYRIGLYLVPLSGDLQAKAGDAQGRFATACVEAGAEIVSGQGNSCDLMIVQQRPYSNETVQRILSTVRARRVTGLMALAMAGFEIHEAYLTQFGIDKVYVPNLRFMQFLLKRRNAESLYRGIDVEQVGLPYDRVRLEPDFEAEWMVATPTGFSFRREEHKHAFLKAVLALLKQIGPQDRVVYKPHNGERRDYLAPPGYARIAWWGRRIPGGAGLTALGARLPGRPGRRFAKLYTAFLHERVLRRCTPLWALTDRDWLAFEAFLPGVRKGVIGGLSNTIWGTLYFRLPFYNCVDLALRDSVRPDIAKGEKISRAHLDVNLEFFGLPYCAGRLDAPGAAGAGIVRAEDRGGDLVATVERDLRSLQKRRSCAS